MIDDAEPYAVHDSRRRLARREHKCYECGRIISPGETYEYATGLMAGHWYHHKTCAHCIEARKWLIGQCGGYVYEGVLEDLREHWDEDWLLRSVSLGRLIVGMRSGWKRHGELMPVPSSMRARGLSLSEEEA